MWLGGRHRKPDLRPVGRDGQRFASHRFDRWPVLPEDIRGVVEVWRLYLNAASFSTGARSNLKVKIETHGFRLFLGRLIVAAHLLFPPIRVGHSRFLIWIFVGHDCGAIKLAKIAVSNAGRL